MSILRILHYPEDCLLTKASAVEKIDSNIQCLVDDMLETMYAAHGAGLAAPQVGVSKRIFVMDLSREKNNPQCVINPIIEHLSGSCVEEEGCLSIPGPTAKIERAEKVKITGFNQFNQAITIEGDGLLARCALHEIDHLNGVLYIKYLSSLKKKRVLDIMAKTVKAKKRK